MQIQQDPLAALAMGQYPVNRWLAGSIETTDDWVAEEVPVALVYNGLSHAVMLCSPHNLDDFARGFSLSECIVDNLDQIYSLEIHHQPDGIEVAMEISQERFWALKSHRRTLAGRSGCGLCGKESLAQLACNLTTVPKGQPISVANLQHALQQLNTEQHLFNKTGSVHAAAWCDPEGHILSLREDVGRHNALDKLVGQRRHTGQAMDHGLVIMTSRASYEIVQKAAACGVSMIAAVSGPTGMAVRLAQDLGVTLIGFARHASLCVYTHPERIL